MVCEAEEAGEVAVGDGEAGGEDAGGEGATPSEGPASEGVEAKGSRKGSAKEVAVSKSTSKETAEAEEKENLRVAVKKSSELHGSISDCYRSLFYLEKFFHVRWASWLPRLPRNLLLALDCSTSFIDAYI